MRRLLCLTLILSWLISLTSGCTENPDGKKAQFSLANFDRLISAAHKGHYHKFLLIPGSGCEGCISNAENFVIDNAKDQMNETMIVFTNIVSKKLLRLRLGKEIISQPNVLMDSTNTLHYTSIYPQLVEKDKNGNLNITDMK